MRALVLIVAAAACLCGCAAPRLSGTADLPNLACVDPARNVWRCGQPTAAGVATLKAMGVTNALKLNEEPEPDGLHVTVHPLDALQQIVALTPADRAALIEAVRRIQPGTVIHCLHGEDRTGLACALYRVLVQGWSTETAEKEMLARGFHKELYGLWDAWEDFKKGRP